MVWWIYGLGHLPSGKMGEKFNCGIFHLKKDQQNKLFHQCRKLLHKMK